MFVALRTIIFVFVFSPANVIKIQKCMFLSQNGAMEFSPEKTDHNHDGLEKILVKSAIDI